MLCFSVFLQATSLLEVCEVWDRQWKWRKQHCMDHRMHSFRLSGSFLISVVHVALVTEISKERHLPPQKKKDVIGWVRIGVVTEKPLFSFWKQRVKICIGCFNRSNISHRKIITLFKHFELRIQIPVRGFIKLGGYWESPWIRYLIDVWLEPDLIVILHKKCEHTRSSWTTVFADGRRKLVIFRVLLTFIIYTETYHNWLPCL